MQPTDKQIPQNDNGGGNSAASAARINVGTMPPDIIELLREKFNVALPTEHIGVGKGSRLPRELVDIVAENLPGLSGLMSRAEAEEHRLRLMDERTSVSDTVDSGSSMGSYNFCEH